MTFLRVRKEIDEYGVYGRIVKSTYSPPSDCCSLSPLSPTPFSESPRFFPSPIKQDDFEKQIKKDFKEQNRSIENSLTVQRCFEKESWGESFDNKGNMMSGYISPFGDSSEKDEEIEFEIKKAKEKMKKHIKNKKNFWKLFWLGLFSPFKKMKKTFRKKKITPLRIPQK